MLINEKMLSLSNKLASKLFYKNKHNFTLDGMTVKDVIQEANLVVFELLDKYKDKTDEELMKLTHSSVNRKLMNLKRNANEHFKKFTPNKEIATDEGLVLDYDYKIELLSKIKNNKFVFEEILAVLNDEEYNIISELIKHKSTVDVVAKKLGYSKSKVHRIYHDSLKKIASYLDIEHLI